MGVGRWSCDWRHAGIVAPLFTCVMDHDGLGASCSPSSPEPTIDEMSPHRAAVRGSSDRGLVSIRAGLDAPCVRHAQHTLGDPHRWSAASRFGALAWERAGGASIDDVHGARIDPPCTHHGHPQGRRSHRNGKTASL